MECHSRSRILPPDVPSTVSAPRILFYSVQLQPATKYYNLLYYYLRWPGLLAFKVHHYFRIYIWDWSDYSSQSWTNGHGILVWDHHSGEESTNLHCASPSWYRRAADNHLLPVRVQCVLSIPLFPYPNTNSASMSAFWVCLPRFFLSAVEIFGMQAYDYICSLEQEVMNISHLVFLYISNGSCPKWTYLRQSRWTKVKYLYIVTRYVPFLFFISHLYSACSSHITSTAN